MKVLVSALEYSANVHLKSVKNELDPNIEFIGVFDKHLGDPIVDLQGEAVMGYVDAIKKLRFYFKLLDQMVKLAAQADKILLIDASGFNLPLAKKLKETYPQKEIIYYILPEAWAWKRGRIAKLEKRVDTLASILPFEKDYYSSAAAISYVGHPLLDQIYEFKSDIAKDIKTITLMPGSRKSIIRKLMPTFHEVSSKVGAEFTIVIPRHFSQDEVNELYGNLSRFTIVYDAREALLHSDFAFICKGTATLEASLIGTPFVLVYKFAFIDYLIYKWLVKIPYLGLGNILLGYAKNKVLHPELIQKEVTVENLISSMQDMDRDKYFNDAKVLRKYLKHGSAKNIAKIIEKGL
ncbi:MAG TPA: lipid-A-disaccharide synthase [Sulfurovum sp.]|nr:lipid-A-disaccharide synthase [Sulfurovum sp.]